MRRLRTLPPRHIVQSLATACLASICAAPLALAAVLDGDFDGDGDLDCVDVDRLVAVIASGESDATYDMDRNGYLSVGDLDEWRRIAGAANLATGEAYMLGDANLDGLVDGHDVVTWRDGRFTPTASWCAGDFTASGVIDGADFVLLNQHLDVPTSGGGSPAGDGGPGDGIPDVYYFQMAATAPNGETRPAGTLLLDTDGTDFVALLVASPDLTADCILCDGGTLPGTPENTYVLGYSNGSTQWIRVDPLTGPGAIGVFDLASRENLDQMDFPGIFEDGGMTWSVQYASAGQAAVFTNVQVISASTPAVATSWGGLKQAFE